MGVSSQIFLHIWRRAFLEIYLMHKNNKKMETQTACKSPIRRKLHEIVSFFSSVSHL